jgi:hypothetical protein
MTTSLGDAVTIEARDRLRWACSVAEREKLMVTVEPTKLLALLADGDRLEWLGAAPWEELKIVESYIIDGNGARTAIDWVRNP